MNAQSQEERQFAIAALSQAQRGLVEALSHLAKVSPMASQLIVATKLRTYIKKLADVQREVENLPI